MTASEKEEHVGLHPGPCPLETGSLGVMRTEAEAWQGPQLELPSSSMYQSHSRSVGCLGQD